MGDESGEFRDGAGAGAGDGTGSDRGFGFRRIERGGTAATCPVVPGGDGVWEVRGYEEARAVLRTTATVQAGLGVEMVSKIPKRIRRPVLYRDGPEHREHRRQTARFFTPRRVDEHYRDVMVRVAQARIDRLRADGRAPLSDLSFDLAIEVACAVIGLTDSRPGIKERLERFFPQRFGTPGLTSPQGIYWMLRQNTNWLRVYLGDVRPAVRARRRVRRDDLISHLIDDGCSDAEILGECLTFAAAGMVTTREFISAAAWHLFSDAGLLAHYRAADEPGRLAVLAEILRLEPVVGCLSRRTTEPLDLPGADGGRVTVPAGDRIDILLDHINVDERTVGEQPRCLRPGRTMKDAGAPGLAFGDGPHKCPGLHIALLETDVFLSRLFALPGVRMASPPTIGFIEAIGSYELRHCVVEVDEAQAPSSERPPGPAL
ncbi:cytochrome P450 [Streptomyces yaizuensis]|uniref:Cytochrome P450 n=1 Tax=Streptomyces yaizuensis TaxID=2989713 RepID=A0ABQ5NSE5_9ACTN|nr:cytochrome P450 [Streptomyces sp. YSPA8]GLF93298.1 cytochrome P450 [Streptomyces sp. YSPA8]